MFRHFLIVGVFVVGGCVAQGVEYQPVPAPPPVRRMATPVGIQEFAQLPPRREKEGWISFFNTSGESYFLSVDQKAKRIFLSRFPDGGFELPSGTNRAVNVRKESYKMYGDNGQDLKVRVREGETTRVTLHPFGTEGGGILRVTSQDREKVQEKFLFGRVVRGAAPVVVRPAPVVVAPAPMVVVPGPTVVVPGPPPAYVW